MTNDAEALIEQARADPTIDRLWAREAVDRVAAYRRGEPAARDLSDIVAKYRL